MNAESVPTPHEIVDSPPPAPDSETSVRRGPPPAPGSVERRRHERYPLLAQVVVESGGVVSLLEAQDISLGGMFLAAGDQDEITVSRGDTVDLYVDLGLGPNHQPLELRAVGRVVRTEDGQNVRRRRGFAVLWTKFTPAFATQLQYIIEHVKSGRYQRPDARPRPRDTSQ